MYKSNIVFFSDLKTMQTNVYFHKEDSNAKEKQITLNEKIDNIEEVIICSLHQDLNMLD